MKAYLKIFLMLLGGVCLPLGQALGAETYEGKRVFILHSYHESYPWTQGIHKAILNELEGKELSMEVFYMDTKNHASESEKLAAAETVKAQIETFKPDVVITSDDDAVKYVLMPYYKDSSLPFVFCGVNGDGAEYGLPYRNTTGMLEIELLEEIVKQVRDNTHRIQNKIGVLALNGFTERKRAKYYSQRLGNQVVLTNYFVNSFEQWKRDFLKLQTEVDMILMLNTEGLEHWDMQQAAQFVLENIKIPTASATAWMSKVSLLGISLVPEEQGAWAAQAALKILSGQSSPNNMPIVHNQEGKLFVNINIAEKLGIRMKPALLKYATPIH